VKVVANIDVGFRHYLPLFAPVRLGWVSQRCRNRKQTVLRECDIDPVLCLINDEAFLVRTGHSQSGLRSVGLSFPEPPQNSGRVTLTQLRRVEKGRVRGLDDVVCLQSNATAVTELEWVPLPRELNADDDPEVAANL
jgi:hypothetical protein